MRQIHPVHYLRVMTRLACLALVLFTATRVHADELVGDHDDRGRVTKIGRGVWEIDLGALGVLTSDKEGDTSVMRLSSDLSAGVQRFVADNISVGGEVLFD